VKLENGAARKLEDALQTWPHAGSGVHSHLMAAANLAAIAGIPAAEAEARIIQTMPRPPSPLSEVAAAIRKAYAAHKPGEQYQPRPISPAKPKALPMTRAGFIRKGDGATEADWWEASPYRIDWEPGPRDALALLGALYAPDEFLFIGERYGAEVATVGDWMRRIESGEPCPPHFIPNALTGQEHPLPDGKLSRRGDSAVASFRFAVAEFDTMSKPEQLAFWWGYRSAPIVALICTGGKSIHASCAWMPPAGKHGSGTLNKNSLPASCARWGAMPLAEMNPASPDSPAIFAGSGTHGNACSI
jgi:hypothetical protein